MLERENIALKKELERLKSQLKVNDATPQRRVIVKNTNITNITNNFNINIHLNNFGQESLLHITPQMIDSCTRNKINGLVRLIQSIYFSEEAPQNCTLRLKNKKDRTMEVRENNAWQIRPHEDVFKKMIGLGMSIAEKYYYHNELLKVEDADRLHWEIYSFLQETRENKNINKLYEYVFNLIKTHASRASAI